MRSEERNGMRHRIVASSAVEARSNNRYLCAETKELASRKVEGEIIGGI